MLKIGGLEKVSLLDYPGKVSSVLFTYGCNLRCPFCHNPELVIHPLGKDVKLKEDEVLDYLQERKGLIDAVVITGGEPLIYKDIDLFIEKIKKMGFLVKLDTNGFFPKELKELLKKDLLDYIAMDVKWAEDSYVEFSKDKKAVEKVKESIKIIMSSGIDYEFRATFVKGIHDIEDGEKITSMIPNAMKYYIQNFRSGKTIDETLNTSNSFTEKELKEILRGAKKHIKSSYIR
ncbi:MAG TPA: anaerobic ribonucleoside-triphosphate reductase activating protein [Candidatus Dojkabacteria bacterium]|nr:anaerobic ribonucleoside-triphosphate reductase activating protein [Candidatus Dojkabacteria bacterium]